MQIMDANVFCGANDIRIEEVTWPRARVDETVERILDMTIANINAFRRSAPENQVPT